MLYMVIEEFTQGAVPVYARLREKGRMTPEGLHYVNSWVASDMRRCYQVMETLDPTLLKQWMRQWDDIVDFEVVPVLSSSEAASAAARPSGA